MVEFDEKSHTYVVDGVVLPSVTQIIRFLNYDTATTAKTWLRDVAADRGSRVHQYCMLYDFGELPDDIDFDCIGYVKAYMAFCKDYQPKWEVIEKPLGNVDYGYAGTVDRMGDIDGKQVVLDIKTGAKVNPVAVAAQLTAYEYLLQTPYETERLCLQLNKDGTYKLTKHDKAHDIFMSCFTLHKALQKGKKNG